MKANNRKFLIFGASSLITGVLAITTFMAVKGTSFINDAAKATIYSLTLDNQNAYSSGETKSIQNDNKNYNVEFTYDNCLSASNAHATINVGGSITNTEQITSIAYFSVTYSGGTLRCKTSYDCSAWNEGFILTSGEKYAMGSNPYFIQLVAETNAVTLTKAVYEYTCVANTNIPEAVEVTYEYQKITDSLADYSGQYLIVYEDGNAAFNGGLSTLDATNNKISVTIDNDTIESNATTDAASFTIAKSENSGGTQYYSIKSSSGYYIGRSAYSNGLDSSSSVLNNEISVDEYGTAIYGSGGCELRFNNATDQKRFRYYKSGQQAIDLYKKVQSGEEMPTINEPVALYVEDSNLNEYTTNSIFDNDNGLTVTALMTDGTTKTLAKTEYSYVVEYITRYPEVIDTSAKFNNRGTYSVTVSYGNLLPVSYSFEVGEYIYATGLYLHATTLEFTTADVFANYLDTLSADIEFSNPEYDTDDIQYSSFANNNLSVQLLNTGGAAYNLNQPFGEAGNWQIKLIYSYKGVELSDFVDIVVSAIPVQSVTISDSTLSLEVGNTAQLTAEVNPTNATNTNVVWSSDKTNIATVSSSGLVTAVTAGTATIKATSSMDNTKIGQCVVTVTKPSIVTTEYVFTSASWGATKDGVTANWTSITNGNGFDSTNGRGIQVTSGNTASGTSDVSFDLVTKVIVEYSSNSGTGSIDTKVGSTSIGTVSFSSLTATKKTEEFTVNSLSGYVTLDIRNTGTSKSIWVSGITIVCNNNPVYPTSISISGNSSVNVGDTTQLSVGFTPSDTTKKNITWTSADTTIATVSSSGLVTGKKAGTVVITATGEYETGTAPNATITITVNNVAVTGVSLNTNNLALTIGNNATLTATVSPSNATNKGVSFTSSNTGVATVGETSGNVIAVSKGSATITATSLEDGSKKATCTVTVSEQLVTSITVNPNTIKLEPGASSQLTATVSPSNAANKAYTWSSNNQAVATVSSSGLLTAVDNGTATITATANDGSNVKGTCTVTVSTSSSGQTTTDFDTWTLVESSNDFDVGDVVVITSSQNGKVAGNLSGKYLASVDAVFASDYSTVTLPTSASQFVIGGSSGSYTLTNQDGELLGSNSSKDLLLGSGTTTWSISVSSGEATIQSTASNNGAICYNVSSPRFKTYANLLSNGEIQLYKGSVSTPVYPTSISISGSNEIGTGKSTQLSLNYTPTNTNQKSVLWTSGDTSIATVNQTGLVKAVNVGTTTITARETKENGQYIYATFNVEVTSTPLDAYTILIYMCGADLESGYDSDTGKYSDSYLASGDLDEIKSVSGQSDDINIVVEAGGSRRWKSSYTSIISTSKLNRFHLSNRSYVLDEQISNASMGLSSTFQSFLEWGLTNYPAQKTGVILWNHGGGMRGVCYDELHSNDSLYDDEVKTAIVNAYTNTGTSKLEWIGYDACLMQLQDVAEFNSPYFNYMVASQESEAGYGWDYDTWVDDLYAGKSSETIFKAICDGFITDNGGVNATGGYYQGTYYPADQTLSYLDLRYMSAYMSAWDDMSSQLRNMINIYRYYLGIT